MPVFIRFGDVGEREVICNILIVLKSFGFYQPKGKRKPTAPLTVHGNKSIASYEATDEHARKAVDELSSILFSVNSGRHLCMGIST